ncbi:MAG: hypothetical protein K8I60_10385 [Anaerolineae bacterium]|nr:hypothetical protein [Anaerolineae bacterium]
MQFKVSDAGQYPPWLVRRSAEGTAAEVTGSVSDHYDFPMPVIIGGNYYEMVFLNWLMWYQAGQTSATQAIADYTAGRSCPLE